MSPSKLNPGQSARVRVKLRNTGDKVGSEVVQLYVHDGHAKIERPPQELKGFQKVYLQPGESKEVEFTVNQSALSYYSEQRHDWVAEPGAFELSVGASSRDIRLTRKLELGGK
jgi:beta-glucosidase